MSTTTQSISDFFTGKKIETAQPVIGSGNTLMVSTIGGKAPVNNPFDSDEYKKRKQDAEAAKKSSIYQTIEYKEFKEAFEKLSKIQLKLQESKAKVAEAHQRYLINENAFIHSENQSTERIIRRYDQRKALEASAIEERANQVIIQKEIDDFQVAYNEKLVNLKRLYASTIEPLIKRLDKALSEADSINEELRKHQLIGSLHSGISTVYIGTGTSAEGGYYRHAKHLIKNGKDYVEKYKEPK